MWLTVVYHGYINSLGGFVGVKMQLDRQDTNLDAFLSDAIVAVCVPEVGSSEPNSSFVRVTQVYSNQ